MYKIPSENVVGSMVPTASIQNMLPDGRVVRSGVWRICLGPTELLSHYRKRGQAKTGVGEKQLNQRRFEMSCFICGRDTCTPSFHSLEEQQAFERAEKAYERFLEIREECRREWEEREEGEKQSN